MPGSPSNCVIIDIATLDICDSIGRVLADVQRFGWKLTEIAAVASPARHAELRLAVSAPSHVELVHIRDRLARHPSIVDVQARLAAADSGPGSSRALKIDLC